MNEAPNRRDDSASTSAARSPTWCSRSARCTHLHQGAHHARRPRGGDPRRPAPGVREGRCARPSEIGQIIHGTTLATNALIERRGARTALITTQGFRDVIEMRTESRFEQYDLNLELPEPLLPRRHRYTLAERMSARGEVLVPLARSRHRGARATRIGAAGHESVAVGFLHAHVDGAHERLVREVLAERLPQVSVSLSCEVSPQMREYERFSTTIANAYVRPLVEGYLTRLEGAAGAGGRRLPGVPDAFGRRRHVAGERCAFSGAPGRVGACGRCGVRRHHRPPSRARSSVLSFDMGGTTAKICLIRDGAPRTARTFEVARAYRFKKGSGMPISIPVIDMVEIGTGGGSLADVDAMGRIRVGPRSAGSEPGPACYGRGGEAPAVTDADLVLGRLDPDGFAGGTHDARHGRLEGGARARGGRTARHGRRRRPRTACAEVVDENMANAARVHAVENGEDLADYTMIAFGGAAPLHAARLCEKLGIERCLVPPGAGVGSAIGFLRAPFAFEATRSVHTALSTFEPATGGRICWPNSPTRRPASCTAARRTRRCAPRRRRTCATPARAGRFRCGSTPPWPPSPDAAAFRDRFETDYAALFGRTVADTDVEITSWAVDASTAPDPVEPVAPAPDAGAGGPSPARARLFDPALERVPWRPPWSSARQLRSGHACSRARTLGRERDHDRGALQPRCAGAVGRLHRRAPRRIRHAGRDAPGAPRTWPGRWCGTG